MIRDGETALAASNLLGRGSSGNISAITIDATLAFATAVLGVAKVPNALTINNAGTGAASGGTFDGSAAVTISTNSIGAAKAGLATASLLTMNTARLLGRTTASAGAIEELTVGASRRVHRRPVGLRRRSEPTRSLTVVIDGGGSPTCRAQKGHIEVPFDCTLNRVTTMADTVGSIVIDVWKDTYANFPPTVADTITALGEADALVVPKGTGQHPHRLDEDLHRW